MNYAEINNEEAIESNDYSIKTTLEEKGSWKYYKLYFKDNSENLLSYISFNINTTTNLAYVIDITNGSGYEYMSEEMKKRYDDNGYKSGIERKGFGEIIVTYVLNFIKREYPNVDIVVYNSNLGNEKVVNALIHRVRDTTGDLISKLAGGGDRYAGTIFL